MKIVDCFIFYNELDLLNYRLNVLNDVVDCFVLVEATRTFTGKQKPLHYAENKHLFEPFNHKIVHIVVDNFPFTDANINFSKNEQWLNEACQRNAIERGLGGVNAEDIVIITDVDEIPDCRTLAAIKKGEVQVHMHVLEMEMYYYNLTTKFDTPWRHPKIIKRGLLTMPCNDLRQYNCPCIRKGGWHLSYFGDARFIQNKIIHFSHQELNTTAFTDLFKIEQRIKNGSDLYDRRNDLKKIALNKNSYLPLNYEVYLKSFF